jgi:ligand-binding SRPBCC domain-containing protein
MLKSISVPSRPRGILMSETFTYRSEMPASAEAVYRFHAEPDALERLTPPWEKAQVVARTGSIERPGSKVTLRVSVGPFSQHWIAEHVAVEPNRMFRDVMLTGPFRRWEHIHKFIPETDHSSWLEDVVEYEFPLGWLGKLFGGAYTHHRLQRMFEYRHRVTAEQLIARTANTKQHS